MRRLSEMSISGSRRRRMFAPDSVLSLQLPLGMPLGCVPAPQIAGPVWVPVSCVYALVERDRREVLRVGPLQAAAVAAEREVLEQLRARPEVAVQLDHRPRLAPPVFAEDLLRGRDHLTAGRVKGPLGGEVHLVVRRVDGRRGRGGRRRRRRRGGDERRARGGDGRGAARSGRRCWTGRGASPLS